MENKNNVYSNNIKSSNNLKSNKKQFSFDNNTHSKYNLSKIKKLGINLDNSIIKDIVEDLAINCNSDSDSDSYSDSDSDSNTYDYIHANVNTNIHANANAHVNSGSKITCKISDDYIDLDNFGIIFLKLQTVK